MKIIKETIEQLNNNFNNIIKSKKGNVDFINQKNEDLIIDVLNNQEFIKILEKIKERSYISKLDYEDLMFIDGVLEDTYKKIHDIKNKLEVDFFLKNGYILDKNELNNKYKDKIKALHPNLDINKLYELYLNPPTQLKVLYSDDKIKVDKFEFRKFLIALIQMIYNHMDLVVVYTGSEGSGKSTKCSQHMFLVWWVLTEIKVINYKFDIKDMFFNSLHKFLSAEDRFFNEPYRIMALDEGNELHRQNWRDDDVNLFFQKLRRERYNKRIKFICIPVLGEMIPNIVLSRVNFIFEMDLQSNIKSGTLEKGNVNFYIIPRGDIIYSPAKKRELSVEFIKQTLEDNLKDRSYLKGVPKDILIKKLKSNGVWGFKESDYIKYLKETNDTFSINKKITLPDPESFCLYKAGIKLKDLNIKNTDYRYKPVARFLNKLNKYWEDNYDLLSKYEARMKRMKGETDD